MKRNLALLITVAIAASFLAGCQPQPEPTVNATNSSPTSTPKDKKLSGGYTDPQ